jgi:hypothetical protein
MRIGEALGLRREDMHLLASNNVLGCSVRDPHIHVRRRANANGSFAKSRFPRSIPVTADVVDLYADYQFERSEIPEGDSTDFVFVNLYASGPMSITADVAAPNCEGEACSRRLFALQASCVGGQA